MGWDVNKQLCTGILTNALAVSLLITSLWCLLNKDLLLYSVLTLPCNEASLIQRSASDEQQTSSENKLHLSLISPLKRLLPTGLSISIGKETSAHRCSNSPQSTLAFKIIGFNSEDCEEILCLISTFILLAQEICLNNTVKRGYWGTYRIKYTKEVVLRSLAYGAKMASSVFSQTQLQSTWRHRAEVRVTSSQLLSTLVRANPDKQSFAVLCYHS